MEERGRGGKIEEIGKARKEKEGRKERRKNGRERGEEEELTYLRKYRGGKKEGCRREGRGKKVEGSVREREEEVSWKDRGEKESGCTKRKESR